jgi:hypothetical protein
MESIWHIQPGNQRENGFHLFAPGSIGMKIHLLRIKVFSLKCLLSDLTPMLKVHLSSKQWRKTSRLCLGE